MANGAHLHIFLGIEAWAATQPLAAEKRPVVPDYILMISTARHDPTMILTRKFAMSFIHFSYIFYIVWYIGI